MSFDRQGVADHAKNLANTIQGNLKRSLESLGVDILTGAGAPGRGVGGWAG